MMSHVAGGKLLGRMRLRRAPAGGSGRPEHTARGDQRPVAALDWRAVLEVLDPVRHRWDLAILCNLDEQVPRRTADLLAAINAQVSRRPRAAPERRTQDHKREQGDRRQRRKLLPQVLSGRLRSLEDDGYIRHQDLSRLPLVRVYVLLPRGRRLIGALTGLGLDTGRRYSQAAGGSQQ